MARALRSPMMSVFLLLALFWPLPGRAVPIGASIALTNVVLDYQPDAKNLSAEAAAIGGLPALPLPARSNGTYIETAAGDFAVTFNLPPLDQQHHWLISDDITINGQHAFGGQEIVGPLSVMDAIDAALSRVSPFVQGVIKAQFNLLLAQPLHDGFGILDWAYNRDPADDTTGTFAVGSKLNLPQIILGEQIIPGEFTFSLSASAFAVDLPEPIALPIFPPALLVLLALRRRTARRVAKVL